MNRGEWKNSLQMTSLMQPDDEATVLHAPIDLFRKSIDTIKKIRNTKMARIKIFEYQTDASFFRDGEVGEGQRLGCLRR